MNTPLAYQDEPSNPNQGKFSPFKDLPNQCFIQDDPLFLLSLSSERDDDEYLVLEDLESNTKAIITSDFQKRIMVSYKPYCPVTVKKALDLVKGLDEENISKIYEYEETSEGVLNIHYEYTNKSKYFQNRIYNQLNAISNEFKLRAYLYSLFEGIRCLHERELVHMSITLASIELHKEDILKTVKLSSFFTVQVQSQPISSVLVNYLKKSLPIVPPELEENLRADSSFDVYCAGVVVYEMCTCQIPDEDPKRNQMILKRFVGKQLTNLIMKMLNSDPQERPSMDLVMDHPWFLI